MRIKSANDVREAFQNHFGEEPELIVRAPGRINLLGEHTDYNEGFVLPAAINRAIFLAFSPQEMPKADVVACDMHEEHATLSWEENSSIDSHHWSVYPYGVMQSIKQLHPQLPKSGFKLVFGGDIPSGAGLSSSAAIESGIIYGLSTMFGWQLPRLEMALLAQYAEQKFVGLQCGLMDMYASLHGKKDAVIQLDCRTQTHGYFPLDLGDYELVLFNTNVKHALVNSAYNRRREACEKGVEMLQKQGFSVVSLRDASMDMLLQVKSAISTEVWNRCSYVIQENERVRAICEALDKGNLQEVGALMKQTHRGLSQLYEVSCPELDFLADQAISYAGVLGARMMGGGFGGCTLNLVHKDQVENLCQHLKFAYEKAFPLPLTWYRVTPQEGCEVVWKKNLAEISL